MLLTLVSVNYQTTSRSDHDLLDRPVRTEVNAPKLSLFVWRRGSTQSSILRAMSERLASIGRQIFLANAAKMEPYDEHAMLRKPANRVSTLNDEIGQAKRRSVGTQTTYNWLLHTSRRVDKVLRSCQLIAVLFDSRSPTTRSSATQDGISTFLVIVTSSGRLTIWISFGPIWGFVVVRC